MVETADEETPVGDTVEIPVRRGAETSAEIAGNLILYMDGSQNFEGVEPYILTAAQLAEHFRETGQHRENYGEVYYITRQRAMVDTLRVQLLRARRSIDWAHATLGTVTDTVVFNDGRYFMQVRIPVYYFEQPYLLTTDCISHNDSIYIFKDVRLQNVTAIR